MNRNEVISSLSKTKKWDFIIIGGGATGLGTAVDAASRGFKTLLIEQGDFAQATSSRSTKLIHGGLRYLQQGNVPLVFEALHERGLLCKNAPHLITHRPFLVPNYKWWEGIFYGVGLKIYDLLAGRLGIEHSYHINKTDLLDAMPTIEQKDLRGATIYYDGQFDDARLAITLAKTAHEQGAKLINYMKVSSLIKEQEHVIGVKCIDQQTNQEHEVFGEAIINATGIFSDEIRKLDDPTAKEYIAPSQGVHLVLPASFLPGDTALLIPHTEDNRVIFLVPWHDRIIVGTTDTPKDHIEMEPRPLEEEIEFLLHHANQYLSISPKRCDILSIFTGLRPLVNESRNKNTKKIARNHKIFTSRSGLISIAGGKWTTYRKMAEDTVDAAIAYKSFPQRACKTKQLRLSGYLEGVDPSKFSSIYGSEIEKIEAIKQEHPEFSSHIHTNLPYTFAEIIYAARYEMVQTLEDALSRRTRSLLLDAKATIEAAPKVAVHLAEELKKNQKWIDNELHIFNEIAKNYLP